MEFLQKYLLIPLDIFQKSKQNRNIKNKMDAWLTLFTSDEPEAVIQLIEEYTEFRKIYEEGYRICLNVGKVMEMLFSEELYELDRNTVQYMIDEMQDTIDAQNQTIEELQRERERLLGAQEQGIISAISLLQSLNLPEQEIIVRISGQYQLDEAQVQRYL